MLFVFSSSFHQETFTHTPFRILLCRSWIVPSCSWLKNWTPCVQKLHYWRQRNGAIALSYALLIFIHYKWFTCLVNHRNSVESTLKISDLIENEIFQPLTLRSQNSLLDKQNCSCPSWQFSPFLTTLTAEKMWYIWSHVGHFLAERTIVEETLEYTKKKKKTYYHHDMAQIQRKKHMNHSMRIPARGHSKAQPQCP